MPPHTGGGDGEGEEERERERESALLLPPALSSNGYLKNENSLGRRDGQK